MTSCLLSGKRVERAPYVAGPWAEGRESQGRMDTHLSLPASVRINLG